MRKPPANSASNSESGISNFLGARMRLILCLAIVSSILILIPAAVQGDGSVYATRGSDGTTAKVSWDKYEGDSFDGYRFIVCPRDSFDGGACSDDVYDSGNYSDIDSTGPVTATGLDRYTAYVVILQVRRTDGQQTLQFYDGVPRAA